ncbi:hypothetical protein GCM10017772_14150 [Promicromonospora soli]|uniref:Ig-like domain-containing protein n=1 Tax=Promicromonospora soli TaxID=2035533 RepID=A0A919KRF8_9MICO|nr:hypothetical protein GCM10017772_14150 [Promicromonospora soli]
MTHTAISTGSAGSAGLAMMLRSDGQVVGMVDDDRFSQPVIPALPDGLEYTAVSAGESGASFLLRSDGELITVLRGTVPVPQIPALPAGMSYVAVDAGLAGAYAVRSDGQIVGFKAGWSSSLPLTCADAFSPPAGLKYTAINVDHLSWAALRSDGAVVYCFWGSSAAEVLVPDVGTRYTGVKVTRGANDTTRNYGYAARDDGAITAFGFAPAPAQVPLGRTVVGLAAYERSTNGEPIPGGAAVLDDGTVMTWGGAESDLPPEIPGVPGFAALSSSSSEKWLIRRGNPVSVEMEVTSSTTVNYNERTDVEVRVMAGQVSPTGVVRLGYLLDDGTTWWEDAPQRVVDGRVTFSFKAYPEGTYHRMLRFDGPPFTTTELPVDFVVRPQQPSTLTVDMPESWRVGESGVYVQTHVTAEGGASTEGGSLRVIAEATGEALSTSSYLGRLKIDTSVLPVGGNQRVRVDYLSEGPAASTSWVGRVTVLPTPETVTTAESELVVDYADYSALLDVDVSVRTRDGSRLGVGSFEIRAADGTVLGSSGQLWDDESGVLTDSVYVYLDEMPPGEYPVTVAWVPTHDWDLAHPTGETLPSQWTGTLTIRKAPTSTRVATSNGFEYGRDTSVSVAVVPSTITDVEGELVAKIDGVEVGRADVVRDRTDTSGVGVSVPVLLSGVSAGTHQLEISYLGSDRLKPSAVSQQIEVARAAFSAPAVTVVGTAQVGATLTANRGTWTPVPSSMTYVWMADGVPIAGATTSSLTVPESALGKRISVAVTGARANYTNLTRTSTQTVPVLGVFAPSRLPSVSGTVQVGKTLTANRWTWAPTPTTVKYQWRLDGNAVSGATSKTWTVPASAKGKKVSVAITGARTGYTTKTLVSPTTAAVKAGAFVAPKPTVTGTVKVGSTLKAVRGTWTPQPSTVKYQWKVGGVAVKGATNYWFKVPTSAKGKRVAVVVTGSRTGYVTKTVTSALTSMVR